MKKIRKKIQKYVFVLLAFIISLIPTTVKAESARNDWISGYYYASNNAWGQHSRKYIDGEEVFCIEPSIQLQEGSGYSQGSIYDVMSDDTKDKIELIHHYGYSLSGKTDRDYVYTQQAIWEELGYSVSVGSYNNGNDLQGDYNNWRNNINNILENYYTVPSWNKSTVKGKVGDIIELDGENKIDNVKVVNNDNVTIEAGKIKIKITENSEDGKINFRKFPQNYRNSQGLSLLYTKSGSQTVAKIGLDTDPVSFSVNLQVQKLPTKFRVKKVDSVDGTVLQGAIFEMSYTQDFSSEVWEYKTNADGWTDWDTWGKQGATVYVREKAAPIGYEKSNEVKSFVVSDNGQIELEFKNERKPYDVEISKTDLTTGEVIEGATLEIYDKTTNKLVFSGKTDKDGKLPGLKLTFGEYYFIEKEAPEGYILNPEKQYFKVAKDGTITGNTNLPNELKKYPVVLIKSDSTIIKTLAGAYFEVYNADTNEKVASGITNEKGEFSFKVPFGNYYAIEKKAPLGYILNPEKLYFTVAKNGNVAGNTNLKNKPIENEFELTKKDTMNLKNVPGAEIEIKDAKTGQVVYKGVTDENGKIKVKLRYGKYILTETIAPEGYKKATKNIEVEVTEDGAKIEKTLWNEPITSEFELTKKDTMNLKNVPGAEIEIKDAKTGQVVYKGVTDENGKIKVKLRYGKYILTETIAPEGYKKATKNIEIEVTEDGAKIEKTLWNEPITSEFELTKKDTMNLKNVPGAEIKIKDAKTGQVVYKGITDENGQIRVKLRYGKYILTETIAPEGYVKAKKSLEINVTEDGAVIEQVLWNEPINEIPKTAIPSSMPFNLGMLFVALGLGTVVLVKRAQEK